MATFSKEEVVAFHRGGKAVLVFSFGDNAAAVKALEKAGHATLGENELKEADK